MSPIQEQALELIASGMSQKDAAKKVGVCTRTLRRWKKDPEFSAELQECVAEVRENVQFKLWAKLQQDFDRATKNAEWLEKVRDQCSDMRFCLRAAQIVLEQQFKWARFVYSKPVMSAMTPAESGQKRTSETASAVNSEVNANATKNVKADIAQKPDAATPLPVNGQGQGQGLGVGSDRGRTPHTPDASATTERRPRASARTFIDKAVDELFNAAPGAAARSS